MSWETLEAAEAAAGAARSRINEIAPVHKRKNDKVLSALRHRLDILEKMQEATELCIQTIGVAHSFDKHDTQFEVYADMFLDLLGSDVSL